MVDPGGSLGTPGILTLLIAAAAGGSFLVLVAVRRRRSDDLETGASVPAPLGAAITSGFSAGPPVRASSAPVESQVPRWLRPSVRAARFESDNVKAPRPDRAARLAFATPGDAVTERLIVRYDLVQLLDRPDEALGVPQGELNAGDEIEVLERHEIWTRVQTPSGRAGWVQAMTLTAADIVDEDPGTQAATVAEADNSGGEGNRPALETLLALAAERRAALVDAKRRPASRSERSRNPGKGNRRKSSRA